MTTTMRPFFKHFGSKWRLTAKTPAPRHNVIVEPFAGAAGYSTRYGAGMRVELYDTSEDVCELWWYLLGSLESDILKLPVDEVQAGYDIRTLGLQRGAMRLIQGWITPQGSPGNWWMPPGPRKLLVQQPGAFWSHHIRQRIADQLPLIQRWRVSCKSWDQIDAHETATWHVDPPYQANQTSLRVYGCAPLDYAALGAWCRQLRGQVMVHEQVGAAWLPFRSLDRSAVSGRMVAATAADGDGVWSRTRQHEVWWSNESIASLGG